MLLVPLITGYPNKFCPSMEAIGPQSLSRIRLLVWPAALANFFCSGSRGTTWHVPSGADHSAIVTIVFCRRPGGSNGASTVPIRPPIPTPGAKMLEWAYIHAHPNFVFLTQHCRPNAKGSYYSIGVPITRGRHCSMHCLVSKSYNSLGFQWVSVKKNLNQPGLNL